MTSKSDAETEAVADEDVEISPPNNRVTRASKRKSGKMTDFSQLTESRQRKINKAGRAKDKDGKDVKQTESKNKSRGSSAEFQEEFIESVVTRIQKEDEESKLDISSRSTRRKMTASSRLHEEDELSSVVSDYSERSSESVIASSYCSSSKKVSRKNTSKRGAKDPTVKNPVQKSRRKKQIPIIVSKDEAERELQYTRKTWLDMDPATLGERCLEHLAELDRQRNLCSNISGIVAGRMKDSGAIASEITRAMIEKLTTVGDVIGLRNENFFLKEELDKIKRREQAQSHEIHTLRKMISNLEREVRSLKEGFGPFPPAMPPPAQPDVKTRKKLSSPERRQEKEISREALLPLPQQQEDNLDMEVEPLLLNNTPGCSSNEDYMSRKLEWSNGRETTPWSADAVEVRRATNTNINDKAKFSTYSNTHTKTRTNSNIISDRNINNDRKLSIKSSESAKPYNKGIRLIANKQLVPPSQPSPRNPEWVNVTGKKRRNQSLNSNEAIVESRRRLPSNRGAGAKPGRKLIKPPVVTITNKSKDSSYADILAKAREKVSLKDLGIETTVIRRAMNGAIIIEVPGPQGKQQASTLSSRLAAALGEDAKVISPVAMGELRLRGIDPSTSKEEVYIELAALSGCPQQDFKVSPIINMRDGMGVTWVRCPLETAVRVAERGTVTLGWTRVRVELLKRRPVQCYKCWHFGHARPNCRSENERKGLCFRCGQADHAIDTCRAGFPKCLICEDIGKDSRHRIGNTRCLENQGFPRGTQPIKKTLRNQTRITVATSDHNA